MYKYKYYESRVAHFESIITVKTMQPIQKLHLCNSSWTTEGTTIHTTVKGRTWDFQSISHKKRHSCILVRFWPVLLFASSTMDLSSDRIGSDTTTDTTRNVIHFFLYSNGLQPIHSLDSAIFICLGLQCRFKWKETIRQSSSSSPCEWYISIRSSEIFLYLSVVHWACQSLLPVKVGVHSTWNIVFLCPYARSCLLSYCP